MTSTIAHAAVDDGPLEPVPPGLALPGCSLARPRRCVDGSARLIVSPRLRILSGRPLLQFIDGSEHLHDLLAGRRHVVIASSVLLRLRDEFVDRAHRLPAAGAAKTLRRLAVWWSIHARSPVHSRARKGSGV